MTKSDILAGLSVIVRDALSDDSIVLTADAAAEDFDGWDSLKHIGIVVAAEARFGVKFLTSEIEMLRNVDDFVTLIDRKLRASTSV